MIRRFSVENFRGFAKELTFDLSAGSYGFNTEIVYKNIVKNAIIYGRNGSGKSTLGVALFDIVRTLTDKKKMLDTYIIPYTNLTNASSVAVFKYEFEFGDSLVSYECKKLGPDALLYERLDVNCEKKIEYDHNNPDGYFLDSRFAGDLMIENLKGEISVLKYIKSRTPSNKVPVLDQLMDFVERMLWYRCLSNGNDYAGFKTGNAVLAKAIKELGLVKELEAFFAHFGLAYKLGFDENDAEENLLCYFPDGRSARFFSIASTGTKALLLLFYWTKVAFERASFVFIDEFDAFFHCGLSEEIVKVLNTHVGFQTVVTTHNVALLNNRITRPDCSFIIGNNRIASLANRTDRVLREAHNLEKMYLSGAFADA